MTHQNPPPYNVKLILSYDGGAYFGWQKDQNGPSIEASLERVLKIALQQRELRLQAASRTDRGVHARGQVVNFFSQKLFDPHRLRHSLNSMLPPDIRILEMTIVEKEFHPTLHAHSKEYAYFITNKRVQLPFTRTFSWHVGAPLDLEKMVRGTSFLVGTHDFLSFAGKRDRENSLCTLTSFTLEKEDHHLLCLRLRGDRFLYKMVRNLVGTLVDVGQGKILPEELPSILAGRERPLSGTTAPPHGLFLEKVFYFDERP